MFSTSFERSILPLYHSFNDLVVLLKYSKPPLSDSILLHKWPKSRFILQAIVLHVVLELLNSCSSIIFAFISDSCSFKYLFNTIVGYVVLPRLRLLFLFPLILFFASSDVASLFGSQNEAWSGFSIKWKTNYLNMKMSFANTYLTKDLFNYIN